MCLRAVCTSSCQRPAQTPSQAGPSKSTDKTPFHPNETYTTLDTFIIAVQAIPPEPDSEPKEETPASASITAEWEARVMATFETMECRLKALEGGVHEPENQ
eukprot:4879130-Prymnesium_polylepis.1